MNHSHIGRARLLSSRGGPYHVLLASYTRPDPGAPRVGCCRIVDFPVGTAGASVLRTAIGLRLRGLRSGSGVPPLLPTDWPHPRGIGAAQTSRGSAGAYLCGWFSVGPGDESQDHGRASLPARRGGSVRLRWRRKPNAFVSLYSASPTVPLMAPSTPTCLSNGTGDDPRNDLGLAGARPSVGRLGSHADVALIPSVAFGPNRAKKSCPDWHPHLAVFAALAPSGESQPRVPCTARFWSP